MRPVIGLVATRPRIEGLLALSMPSIARQHQNIDALVVVSDDRSLTPSETPGVNALLPGLDVQFFNNVQTPGVAGTWNTGLRYIEGLWPMAYVAILDDDDTWDADHIALCSQTAEGADWPDVVVSGLRIVKYGEELRRPIPTSLTVDDFLVGNPGWQGSNTFALVSSLRAVDNFTEGLESCNDRDLAIRILSRPNCRVAYTGRPTATWNLNAVSDSLTQPGSIQKRNGLKRFLELHGHRMNSNVREHFLARCADLFGLSEQDLV